MNKLLLAAAGAALLLAPGVALAQTGAAGDAPSASDMKGPPNANGYGKDTGMDKGSTVVGGAGSSKDEGSSGKGMKGSPNADGFGK